VCGGVGGWVGLVCGVGCVGGGGGGVMMCSCACV